jgi:hypothetical protein
MPSARAFSPEMAVMVGTAALAGFVTNVQVPVVPGFPASEMLVTSQKAFTVVEASAVLDTVSIISSVLSVHAGPVEMVHRKTYTPLDKPVMVDVGDEAFEKVGAVPNGPDTIVQAPVPLVGVFAAKVIAVVAVALHWEISGPAAEVVGWAVIFTSTRSCELLQTPFEIRNWNSNCPADKLFIVVVGFPGDTITALPSPAVWLHTPVPTMGVVAVRVVVCGSVAAQIF